MFASAPASHDEIGAGHDGSKSRRPLETITPVAQKLSKTIDQRFSKGDEIALANAITAIDGVVLVCWQHEDIVKIAKAIAPDAQGVPSSWPGDVFNVIFRFDRTNQAANWAFTQIAPVILEGDRSTTI